MKPFDRFIISISFCRGPYCWDLRNRELSCHADLDSNLGHICFWLGGKEQASSSVKWGSNSTLLRESWYIKYYISRAKSNRHIRRKNNVSCEYHQHFFLLRQWPRFLNQKNFERVWKGEDGFSKQKSNQGHASIFDQEKTCVRLRRKAAGRVWCAHGTHHLLEGSLIKRGGIESNWSRAADFNVLRRQGTGLLAHTHSRASIQQDRCVVTVCISHTLTGTNVHFLFTVVI